MQCEIGELRLILIPPYFYALPHVRSGRCDLACPVDCIRDSIDHLGLNPAHRNNITYVEYESGHMMYVNPPDLQKGKKTFRNSSSHGRNSICCSGGVEQVGIALHIPETLRIR
jgi:hypothetical protein